ncbi:MAG: PD40 domain-containing protein, partial [Desulfobulbaceae bacterium]|nr:PD40 domain-containing protein [Candidatus Desulfobia pelagia]
MKILCMVSLLVLFTSCSNELPTVPEKAVPAGFTAVAVDETEWLRNSTAPPNGGWNPAFSPDGQKVAFLSSTLHTPDDLWVMQADGTEPRRLTSRGVISFKWSEDSTTILLKTVRKGFEEVLSISPDGSRETRIPGLPPGS